MTATIRGEKVGSVNSITLYKLDGERCRYGSKGRIVPIADFLATLSDEHKAEALSLLGVQPATEQPGLKGLKKVSIEELREMNQPRLVLSGLPKEPESAVQREIKEESTISLPDPWAAAVGVVLKSNDPVTLDLALAPQELSAVFGKLPKGQVRRLRKQLRQAGRPDLASVRRIAS